MNRLVIIGNGFDLAHGLPTSYKDFIDDYWKNLELQNYEDNFIRLDSAFDYKQNIVNDYNDFKILVEDIIRENYPTKHFVSEEDIKVHIGSDLPWKEILKFKNDFFKVINHKRSIENWVDVESVYYSSLKEIVKSDALSATVETKIREVKKLNEEFEQVKNLFEIYLNKIDKLQSTNKSILKYFKFINVNSDDYFLEFPKQDREDLEMFKKDYNENRARGVEKITYCLNFNYTLTVDSYIRDTEEFSNYRDCGVVENLQIHGRLNDIHNKVNFGFGDEMDDDYKAIENLDDNEYLRNFKSFQYLQNSNYKTLLDFIDSEKFQVFIMGHSCGLSDRTLLNTVFEHNNCRSIKVFYHQRENGTDNYTEIIQNISRHFNKKKLMREKIVNKTLCQPLPQIQLPKKV